MERRRAAQETQPSLFDLLPPPSSAPAPAAPQLPDLAALFARLNRDYFDNEVPDLPVRWNPRLFSTAGRYHARPPAIQLGVRYHLRFPDEVEDTLKHEMTHAWLHAQGQPFGHTAAFRAKLAEIGASRYAQRHPELTRRRSGRRYLYQCPACQARYAYRRRVRAYSCGRCARGYDPRFQLRLIDILA